MDESAAALPTNVLPLAASQHHAYLGAELRDLVFQLVTCPDQIRQL